MAAPIPLALSVRAMRDHGGGSIINVGSISGLRPEPSATAYSASKGAVHSWTRTAAAAWGADGVRVNAILPAIATPMYDQALERMAPEQLEAHRWMNEESIAMGKQYGDRFAIWGPSWCSSPATGHGSSPASWSPWSADRSRSADRLPWR